MKMHSAKTLLLSLLVSTSVAGCASTPRLDRNLERIGFSDPGTTIDGDDLFRRIGAEPTNALLHFENGRFLLDRGRRGDLEVARVAFANAARLAPDWWQPQVGLAATEYGLGHHDAALAAFAEAIPLRGGCDELCYGLAFVAYRAGYFGLAASAHAAAREATAPVQGASGTADAFLSAAFATAARGHDTAMLSRRMHGDVAAADIGDGNVSIDAYVIRQSRDAASNAGINLLSALELQFGGTLFAANYSKENDDPTSKGTSRSLEVSIPTVSYALNMASTSRSGFSIEASPSVVAVAGKTSRFFEGANVLIVPRGDETEPLERDIGIDLKVTPNEIGDGYIDLTAILELSNLRDGDRRRWRDGGPDRQDPGRSDRADPVRTRHRLRFRRDHDPARRRSGGARPAPRSRRFKPVRYRAGQRQAQRRAGADDRAPRNRLGAGAAHRPRRDVATPVRPVARIRCPGLAFAFASTENRLHGLALKVISRSWRR